MVRQLQLESCKPDWGYVERLATDHEAKLDEKGNRLHREVETQFMSSRLL